MRLLIVSQRLYYARVTLKFSKYHVPIELKRIVLHLLFSSFFSFFFQLNLVVKDRNQREIETDYVCKLYLFPRSRAGKFLCDVMSCSVPLSESHVLEGVF